MWSIDRLYGSNEDVTFSGIHVYTDEGMAFPPSSLSGHDAEHMTQRVRFENVTHNGSPIKTLKDMNLSVGEFVQDVSII